VVPVPELVRDGGEAGERGPLFMQELALQTLVSALHLAGGGGRARLGQQVLIPLVWPFSPG
jgi:hypothetical protein